MRFLAIKLPIAVTSDAGKIILHVKLDPDDKELYVFYGRCFIGSAAKDYVFVKGLE